MNILSKKISALATISVIGLSSVLVSPSAFAANGLKTGEPFKMAGVNAGKSPYVLQVLNGDLNKDKKSENIYLIGNRVEKSSQYYDQFTYVIKDGKSGKVYTKVLKDSENFNLGGYGANINITDLNADGQNDLFLSSPTGGSGGYVSYDLSTMKNGKLVTFLSDKDMAGIDISGKFLDGYQVQLTSKALNKTWTLDLSDSKKMYQEVELYNADGKCIGQDTPGVGMITNFEIVDFYGKKMLKGYQSIKGVAQSDTLAVMALYMVYEKGQWRIVSVEQTTILKAFE